MSASLARLRTLFRRHLYRGAGAGAPGSGSLPAGNNYQLRAAKYTGMRIMDLLAQDLRPSKILTRRAFENAMRVGMAVGGSTNMVLHMIAMAKEADIGVSFETWDALSRTTPTLGTNWAALRLLENLGYIGRDSIRFPA